MNEFTCHYCGRTSTAQRSTKLFCDDPACQRYKKHGKPPVYITCVVCGTTTMRKNSKQRVTCGSLECQAEYARRLKRTDAAKQRKLEYERIRRKRLAAGEVIPLRHYDRYDNFGGDWLIVRDPDETWSCNSSLSFHEIHELIKAGYLAIGTMFRNRKDGRTKIVQDAKLVEAEK